jgi:hypothetical protein
LFEGRAEENLLLAKGSKRFPSAFLKIKNLRPIIPSVL